MQRQRSEADVTSEEEKKARSEILGPGLFLSLKEFGLRSDHAVAWRFAIAMGPTRGAL
jgi:hypothetical protein